MNYQGVFRSNTATINRTFGEPTIKKDNTHEAKWEVEVKGEEAELETVDGREFTVRANTQQAFNKVVNQVQINTL